MNKNEFMELLDYYFRDVEGYIYLEIKAEYEDHFRAGLEEGKTEEEIARALGSPKEIYNQFKDEGLFREGKKNYFIIGDFFSDIADKVSNIFSKKKDNDYSPSDIIINNQKIDLPIHRIEVKLADSDICIENHDKDYIEVLHTAVNSDYDFTVLKEGTSLSIGTYDINKFDINKYIPFGTKSSVKDVTIKIPKGNEANIKINTDSGDMNIYLNRNNLNLFTLQGDISVKSNASNIRINTTSGKINIDGVNDYIDIKTLASDIYVDSLSPELNIDTISGDFKFKLENSNNISINSVSGDIKGVIDNMDINMDISTVSGEIEIKSHMGKKNKNIGRSYSGEFGNGSCTGKIRTVSGDIKIG